MASNSSYDIAIFELVIYALLLPPSVFALARHGLRNLPAWLFLSAFIASQITGASLVISAGRNDYSIAGAIIIQVGLSPLLLGIHGALVQAVRGTSLKQLLPYGVAGSLFLHVAVVAPAALLAYGTSQLYVSDADVSVGSGLRKAGAVLYVAVWLYLSFLVVLCVLRSKDMLHQRWLIISSAISVPLFGIRILYSLLAVFDTSSSTFSVLGGSIAARVLMLTLPLMGVALAMTIAGIMTEHSSKIEALRTIQRGHELEDKGGLVRPDLESGQ